MFRPHHYLSTALASSARSVCALHDGRPVAFCATLPSMGHRGVRRCHRLVVLPDYQGIGLGLRVLEATALLYVKDGFRYTITTSHPAMNHALARGKRWCLTRMGHSHRQAIGRPSSARGTCSWMFMGHLKSEGLTGTVP